MYLVLRKDDQAPAGWTPIVLTAAETPETAAAEGNPGHDSELAVVEWDPTIFQLRTEPVIEMIENPATRAAARESEPGAGQAGKTDP